MVLKIKNVIKKAKRKRMQNNYTLNDRQKILKPLRKMFGLTQKQIADRAGIALVEYQRFEYCSRSIKTASFDIVCRVISAFDNPRLISKFYIGEYDWLLEKNKQI